MKRVVIILVAATALLACVLAFAQQAERIEQTRQVMVAVKRGGSRSVQSANQVSSSRQVSYQVQAVDNSGRAVGSPVTMVVDISGSDVSDTHTERYDVNQQVGAVNVAPVSPWNVAAPMEDDMTAPVDPQMTSPLDDAEAAALGAITARITYAAGGGPGLIAGRQSPARAEETTKFYSVSCAAFRPLYSTQMYKGGSLELRATNIIGSNAFIAPVNLPDGVRVTELRVWFYDTDEERDLHASLDAVRFGEMAQAYVMARVRSSGDRGVQELSDGIVQHDRIDNANCKYTVTVKGFSGDANHRFLGASIQYEVEDLGGAQSVSNW